ncbi:hypothetical protein [Sporomusa sp. KB1]|uniref:hypothetical protein n=1 Tax=Sporomusa sp. KB1 TaxID=943346 RepID=UPI001C9646EC|nr:hypothetical protein [Sporomusa sp. KB1]
MIIIIQDDTCPYNSLSNFVQTPLDDLAQLIHTESPPVIQALPGLFKLAFS